jgi:hypothetical protein
VPAASLWDPEAGGGDGTAGIVIHEEDVLDRFLADLGAHVP